MVAAVALLILQVRKHFLQAPVRLVLSQFSRLRLGFAVIRLFRLITKLCPVEPQQAASSLFTRGVCLGGIRG